MQEASPGLPALVLPEEDVSSPGRAAGIRKIRGMIFAVTAEDGYAQPGRRQVEVVEVGFWHGPVEADRLVGHGQGQGNGVVGLDEAEFAGGDRDAGLAPAVDRVDGGGFGC